MKNSNKKIVRLNGGLGNQMFQYAFAYALSDKFDFEILFDMSWFEEVKKYPNVTARSFELNLFNTECQPAEKNELSKIIPTERRSKFQKNLWKIFKIKKYQPIGNTFIQKIAFKFHKELFQKSDYLYYDGYFQNEKYFKHLRNEILSHFTLNIELNNKNKNMLDKIKKTNSIAIHVRRGDYVTLECAKNFHGTCSLEYYQKAMTYITKKVANPHFFLFSDDIDWVIQNLKINYPFTVINFNQEKNIFDLELMKHCKHNIIANSSFSWWAAWLNKNPDKIIIAPKQWINKNTKKCDIIPANWITF
jgi:hypothetical protein